MGATRTAYDRSIRTQTVHSGVATDKLAELEVAYNELSRRHIIEALRRKYRTDIEVVKQQEKETLAHLSEEQGKQLNLYK